MTSSFRPVNTPLSPTPTPTIDDRARRDKEATLASPATPKPSSASQPQPPEPVDDATTPTRANFPGTALASQKPLPTSPFPDSIQVPDTPGRSSPGKENPQNPQHPNKSGGSEDVKMEGSDEEVAAHGEDGAASDDESVNADGSKSNKKKKSLRFYCTGHPPCNLSFTRSEHLARHIRKHTGERPFACHCARRFSRLDNLRQHAQTVHVNEDIPIDSLAATGVGFRRQIRTDRVRQVGGRARASTAGSIGATNRGHSKSLSTSSIASASSISSSYVPNDGRRRPPPLVMADPRSRVPLEPYPHPADPRFYAQPSESDFSTPTSATFSTEQTSPRWGSGVASPASSHSRSHSMYVGGSRTPGRRLSVPSGANPFQSPHGTGFGRSHFGAGPTGSPIAGPFSPGNSSLVSSPTASTSAWSRRDSISSIADDALRRRTWHPDSRDFNGASRLSQVITPSQVIHLPEPLPPANPAQQSHQPFRLPGIESFDPIPPHRVTPPRRIASPMMIDSDSPGRPTLLPPGDVASDDRRSVTAQWDMGLHRGLTRLDINTPPRDSASAWANEAQQAVLAQAEHSRSNAAQPTVRFDSDVTPVSAPRDAPPMPSSRHYHTMSAPSINTPRENKRHGWYHGPNTMHPVGETIPEGRPHVDRMIHPNVSGFQGFPARGQQHIVNGHAAGGPVSGEGHTGRDPDSLRRLEALVAVATSEGSTATAC